MILYTMEALKMLKAKKEELYQAMDRADEKLKAFPRLHNGLTPDDVRATPEWKAAKAEYNAAFQAVRAFNTDMNKGKRK